MFDIGYKLHSISENYKFTEQNFTKCAEKHNLRTENKLILTLANLTGLINR